MLICCYCMSVLFFRLFECDVDNLCTLYAALKHFMECLRQFNSFNKFLHLFLKSFFKQHEIYLSSNVPFTSMTNFTCLIT